MSAGSIGRNVPFEFCKPCNAFEPLDGFSDARRGILTGVPLFASGDRGHERSGLKFVIIGLGNLTSVTA